MGDILGFIVIVIVFTFGCMVGYCWHADHKK
jgi:hypothetical protein